MLGLAERARIVDDRILVTNPRIGHVASGRWPHPALRGFAVVARRSVAANSTGIAFGSETSRTKTKKVGLAQCAITASSSWRRFFIRLDLTTHVRAAGHTISAPPNPRSEAVRVVERERPDLVLMDVACWATGTASKRQPRSGSALPSAPCSCRRTWTLPRGPRPPRPIRSASWRSPSRRHGLLQAVAGTAVAADGAVARIEVRVRAPTQGDSSARKRRPWRSPPGCRSGPSRRCGRRGS